MFVCFQKGLPYTSENVGKSKELGRPGNVSDKANHFRLPIIIGETIQDWPRGGA